jgi:peptidoglycan/xylan/chitin deacetylase (PgdA/CDA1 family)
MSVRRSLLLAAALMMAACAPTTTPSSPTATTTKPEKTPAPAQPPARRDAQFYESDDFIVTFARQGDTPSSLAARFLGDSAKAWMIEDYNDRKAFQTDQEVVIPKRPWNPSGVYANGFQLVPVLVYHNLAPEAKGRLVIAVSTFEQQMQYLASEGYKVVSLNALVAYTTLGGQLPRKSVVLTFDDGYRSFLQYAYPILMKHGFTATLFVYTDYVGSRNAMSWEELRRLSDEGFTIGAHSKSHHDLRRQQGETTEAFAQRMQAELAQPLQIFRTRLGTEPKFLAYPYGAHDPDVIRKVQDYGYAAAFSVRREGNASFGYPLRLHRSQIYAEMSLKDFARNLNVFHQEPVLGGKRQ